MFEKVLISGNAYEALLLACAGRHLEVARWLWGLRDTQGRGLTLEEISSEISVEDCEIFRTACENGHLEVAQWLVVERLGPGMVGWMVDLVDVESPALRNWLKTYPQRQPITISAEEKDNPPKST